jgi:hypothetical protein
MPEGRSKQIEKAPREVGIFRIQNQTISWQMLAPSEPRLDQAKVLITEISQSNPDALNKIVHRLQDFLQVIGEGRSGASTAIQQEREAIANRMVGFDYAKSEAYHEFDRREWSKLKFPECVSLATVLAEHIGLTIDREAKRRKPVLFHWLQNHWDSIRPLLDQIELRFVSDDS